jgi:hypothetical protein
MAYKETNPLPPLESGGAVLSIAAFETGWMQIKASTAIAGLKGTNYATSWRFFIQHEKSNTKFWYDLGVAHVCLTNPHIFKICQGTINI